MTKHTCGSNVKDPENRSKKACVCGGHSSKASHAKPKGKKAPRSKVPVLG
jgi:hypothetical protein